MEKHKFSVGSNILSSIEKRICASAGKYGGSGTMHNMLFDFTDYTLTLAQTRNIRKKVEDDSTTPWTYNTQQLKTECGQLEWKWKLCIGIFFAPSNICLFVVDQKIVRYSSFFNIFWTVVLTVYIAL